MNKQLDLRAVPNEIIMLAFNLHKPNFVGREYFSAEGLTDGCVKNAFWEQLDHNTPKIVETRKKQLLQDLKSAVAQFGERLDSLENFSNWDRYTRLIQQAKLADATLNNKLERYNATMSLIGEFFEDGSHKMTEFVCNRPQLIQAEKGMYKYYLLSKGNLMYVDHDNIVRIYTESDHKRLIDSLINVLYTQNETPAENE